MTRRQSFTDEMFPQGYEHISIMLQKINEVLGRIFYNRLGMEKLIKLTILIKASHVNAKSNGIPIYQLCSSVM